MTLTRVLEREDVACTDTEVACELAAALRQQGATYGLLSRLFAREVDDELLASLCAASYPSHTENAHLNQGYRGFCRYLSTRWERTRGELAVDYFHTFIGNTQDAEQVAFPYESVYTSPEHLLMQDARDQVLAAYRAGSVVIDEECNPTNDPEDHVAFELAFAGLLSTRGAEALEAGDFERTREVLETKRAFMAEHLLNWAPWFAADIERIAQTGFYRALGQVLVGTLEVDADALDDMLAACRAC